MMRTLATRIATLEQARARALRQWWESLSEPEQQREFEARFGPGSWAWLDGAVADLTLEAIETTTVLWDHYLQWRETQP
jgi:hypothetical protein